MSMKVYTKRHGKEDTLKDAAILLETISKLQGETLIPKGVYRFSSFEEADQWMIQKIANTHAHRKSKI